MTPRTSLLLASACLALLVTAGCDNTGDDALGLAPNSFTAHEFTAHEAGEASDARTPAFFYEGEQEGEPVFGIVLGLSDPNPDTEEELTQPAVVLARFGPMPGEGAYPLVDVFTADPDVPPEDVIGAYFVPDTEAGLRLHYAERGTLFLDAVQAGEAVQGRYQMTVREANIFTGEPVGAPFTVEGAFHAVYREAPEGAVGGFPSSVRLREGQARR